MNEDTRNAVAETLRAKLGLHDHNAMDKWSVNELLDLLDVVLTTREQSTAAAAPCQFCGPGFLGTCPHRPTPPPSASTRVTPADTRSADYLIGVLKEWAEAHSKRNAPPGTPQAGYIDAARAVLDVCVHRRAPVDVSKELGPFQAGSTGQALEVALAREKQLESDYDEVAKVLDGWRAVAVTVLGQESTPLTWQEKRVGVVNAFEELQTKLKSAEELCKVHHDEVKRLRTARNNRRKLMEAVAINAKAVARDVDELAGPGGDGC